MISAFAATGSTSLMELIGWNSSANDIAAINNTDTFSAGTWGFDINQLGAEYREAFIDYTLEAMRISAPLTDENTAYTITAEEVLANDTDADGDRLVISAVSAT